MRIRGPRECADCGARWSYYESGSITCPACGSVESVGTDDDRRLHTDGSATLDLSALGDPLGDKSSVEIADAVGVEVRRYLASRGFIRGGELVRLDGEYVLAEELRHAASTVRRTSIEGGELEAYFVDLLRAAESSSRSTTVPESYRDIRGRAVAAAVRAYRREASRWIREHPDASARTVLGRLRDHTARLSALDGDVPVSESDRFLDAATAIGDYLVSGSRTDIDRAVNSLDDLT